MLKIAITGNIASGKSTVEKILIEKGYKVFDTDKIVHEILENSDEVKQVFKDYDILTGGKIDRKKLGDLVFSNKDKLVLLESIIHPKVKNKLNEVFSMDYDIVFISVPQLFEAGFEKMFDKIIYVTADPNLRLQRLIKRNNLTEAEAGARINSQIKDEKKLGKCDFVIQNNGTPEDLINILENNILNNIIY